MFPTQLGEVIFTIYIGLIGQHISWALMLCRITNSVE